MFLFPVSGKDMAKEGRQRRVERREVFTHKCIFVCNYHEKKIKHCQRLEKQILSGGFFWGAFQQNILPQLNYSADVYVKYCGGIFNFISASNLIICHES